MRTQGVPKTFIACQVCCLGLAISCSQVPHTLYTSNWFTWTFTGFSRENLESWFVSQLCGMLRTVIRRRYSLLLDPMLCRNFAYHCGPLCIAPALAISVQPPFSSSGGHHFSLADTRVISYVPLHQEMALIARMSLLTSPLATNQWNTHFVAQYPLWWGSPVIPNPFRPRLKGALSLSR